MDERLSRRAGRSIRKLALVALMLFAAVVAPIALPIRMIVELRRKDVRKTEQIVRQDALAAYRLALGGAPSLPSTV